MEEGLERGEVLVGPLFTWLVIRSGTSSGVTLSTSVKEGRRRTVVLVEESPWSGTGMSEAESMRRCKKSRCQ